VTSIMRIAALAMALFASSARAFMPLTARGFRASTAAKAVGDAVTGELDFGFPPEKVDLAARLKGKKTIIVGLPGAFTPT